MKKVAIGGGQGFWGDSPDAAIHMIRNADIQYMGCDYLAELTLSIMAKQQLKDPTKGFAPDFTTRILKEAGKEAWDKHIKICTNAGGMNINGCVDGIRQWAEGNSMSGYKIGYVTGDNIKDKIPQLLKDGWTFPNFDYDGNFNDILDKMNCCGILCDPWKGSEAKFQICSHSSAPYKVYSKSSVRDSSDFQKWLLQVRQTSEPHGERL